MSVKDLLVEACAKAETPPIALFSPHSPDDAAEIIENDGVSEKTYPPSVSVPLNEAAAACRLELLAELGRLLA